MENAVVIQNLCKSYRKFKLRNISLTLPEGYILGLIGPNGSGKTTTIKIMMNMVSPQNGKISIFGLEHPKQTREIKNRIGYVGENQYYYGDKTVSWTGDFAAAFFDRWDINLFQSLLNEFEISRAKKINHLSKGMKVKLSLAIAMAHHPDLFLLDEPTAGLDPIIRREILELLLRLSKDQGKSVIISSHITDDLARTADLVAFLIDGSLSLLEEKDQLLANWKRIHYIENELDQSLVLRMHSLRTHQFGHSGVVDNYPEIKSRLKPGIDNGTIKIENIDLDDILIACVEGESPCG